MNLNEIWMQTYTGKRIYLNQVKPTDIEPYEIAHHLSMICRYNGAVRENYTVAKHSWMAQHLIGILYGFENYEMRLSAILHDAHEYIMGDMTAPLKQLLEAAGVFDFYKEVVDKIDKVIGERFGVDLKKYAKEVHDVDMYLIKMEKKMYLAKTFAWPHDKIMVPPDVYSNGMILMGAKKGNFRKEYFEKLMELTELVKNG